MRDEKHDFSVRLNDALDAVGCPPKFQGRQQAVVNMLKPYFGVTQKGARKWLEGDGFPDTKRIPVIAKLLGVRAEWLLSGRGPREPDAGGGPWELLVDTAMLPPEARESMERWAKALRDGQITWERFDALTAAVLGEVDRAA